MCDLSFPPMKTLCLIAVLGCWTSSLLSAEPVLQFTTDAVLVSGATAGGEVVISGVVREPREFIGRIAGRETVLRDEDGDGVVSWELGAAVPVRSMWAAVDLATGEHALGTPGDYPLRLLDAATTETGGPGGLLSRVQVSRDFVHLLVVRPQVGAWLAQLFDGEDHDLDGAATLSVAAAVEDLQPLASSPAAPEELQADDVIVVFDPDAMAMSATRVPRTVN